MTDLTLAFPLTASFASLFPESSCSAPLSQSSGCEAKPQVLRFSLPSLPCQLILSRTIVFSDTSPSSPPSLSQLYECFPTHFEPS